MQPNEHQINNIFTTYIHVLLNRRSTTIIQQHVNNHIYTTHTQYIGYIYTTFTHHINNKCNIHATCVQHLHNKFTTQYMQQPIHIHTNNTLTCIHDRYIKNTTPLKPQHVCNIWTTHIHH